MEKGKIKLLSKDCTKNGDIFYFIAKELNLIFSLDIETRQLDLVDSIPGKSSIEKEYVGTICAYKNELYIGPLKTKSIWVFNLDTHAWTELERKSLPHVGSGSMLQAFVYDESVYMIGSSYPAIIKINPETKKMRYIEEPFIEKGIRQSDAYFRAQHVIKDDVLYLPCCIDNSVLKFNLITGAYEWCTVGNAENRFSGIVYDGSYFWLAPRLNSSIVRWDGDGNVKELPLLEGYTQPINYFLGCVFDGKDILLCNMLDGDSIKVNREKEDVEKKQYHYSMAKQLGDIMICQNKAGVFEIYEDGLNRLSMELSVGYRDLIDFYEKRGIPMRGSNQIYQEDDLFTLTSFLNLLADERSEG